MIHSLANHRPKPLHVVAAIIGEDPGNVRGWLYRLRKEGFGEDVKSQRQGRETLVDLGSTVVLRLMGEQLPTAGSVRNAMRLALDLVDAFTPFAAKSPPMPLDLFAVRAWGKTGGTIESAGFICEGRRELDDCVSQMVGKGWPHVDVINISDINYEIITGWDIATHGPAVARDEFELHYLPRLAEDARPRAIAMFDDLQWRIAGGRRPAAPSNETWAAWAPANAA